jgi:hypothetical protein
VWRVHPAAPAAKERVISTRLFIYLPVEIASGGTNLPLTQARALLTDCAATFKVIGSVTLENETPVRFAAMAPLARSVVERAATVAWVLTASGEEQRLRRALIVEIRGLEFLRAYLPDVRTERDASDLEQARARFLELARTEAGGYELDKKGFLLDVGGEQRPTLTSIVSDATVPHAYAGLSVHARMSLATRSTKTYSTRSAPS